MSIRVVATRHGVYNQILREPFEVFDLLLTKEGNYKPLLRALPIYDKEGNRTGKWRKEAVPAKDWNDEPILYQGKAVLEHEDFAEDLGNIAVNEGPLAGEVQHVGWMRKVPPTTPIGIYPENTDFWSPGVMLPPPIAFHHVGQQSARAAQILEYKGQRQTVTVQAPPQVKVIPTVAA